MLLIGIKLNKFVKKLFKKVLECCNILLIAAIYYQLLPIATREIREKTVDTYPSRLMHVSNCFKTQKMGKKVVNICAFMLDYVPDCSKTQGCIKNCF